MRGVGNRRLNLGVSFLAQLLLEKTEKCSQALLNELA